MLALVSRYDIITEGVMFSICLVMLILISFQQPKMTDLMRMCILGFTMSSVEILVQIAMLDQIVHEASFNPLVFNITYIIFGIIYINLLNLIFSHVNFLSYSRRSQFKYTLLMEAVFSIVYGLIIFYPLATDKLLRYIDGKIYLTGWASSYVICGIIDAILIYVAFLTNRKSVARVVAWGCNVFVPMDILALIIQLIFPNVIITSYTYVMPFMLLYILFHNMKFDENLGCRSDEALYVILDRAARGKKKFLMLYVRFPQLQKREFDDIIEGLNFASTKIVREIEQLSYSMHVFSRNMFTYMGFCYVKDDEDAERIIYGIRRIMGREIQYGGIRLDPAYKMVTVRENTGAGNARMIMGAVGIAEQHFSDSYNREYYNATAEDVEEYIKKNAIEQILVDIRAKGDLDDPRVVCYAQPIVDAATGKFTVAEALMRIENQGHMYFPDEFISVAERINSIHTLTLIIINKVCKKIKSLEADGYKVEAISVNCSTGEFEKRTFAKEILDIIEENEVSTDRIRLEITESVDLSDHDSIMYNMTELNASGVKFYLDDFGTGYSNMERIVTYPFMTIKFDKGMLYKAIEDRKADELFKLLVDFFNKCGIKSLVEGVENIEQRDFAVERGFQLIQGYFYSTPVPLDRLVDFFEKIM